MKRIALSAAALLIACPQARSERPPLQEQQLPPPAYQAPPIQAAPQWQQPFRPQVVNPPSPTPYPQGSYPPAPNVVGQPMVLAPPTGQRPYPSGQPDILNPQGQANGQPRLLNPPPVQGQYPTGQPDILNPQGQPGGQPRVLNPPVQVPSGQPQSVQGDYPPGQYPTGDYPPLRFPAAQSPMTQLPQTVAPQTVAPVAQPGPAPTASQDQAATTAPIPPAPQWPNQWVPAASVRLQALDKVNAQTASLTVKVGQPATFGSLTINVKSCAVRPPDQPADAAAYLDVTDSHPDQPGFAGWMLANEPSVSMMQNPIYDLRVTGCG